ncbi:acetyl-CoA carboxylase carboxyltransferase subunit alpha [bacterium]|nr:acetyl-CoA carboxylase carboxyltransferase subunit alpha [bacterium]MBU1919523.1 acetyl-CoA carboxylase carboxyltransferase subunit alpha [bacterium]RQV95428.1 MAG: acetyl-CoA carboxylase carboxyltransferase subunit alpha [bacterium]
MASPLTQTKPAASKSSKTNGSRNTFASTFVLDFEKPVIELERKIAEMRGLATGPGMDTLKVEIDKLEKKANKLRKEIFAKLTRWQKVQLARHPRRPYMLDYVERICDTWLELHGDRCYADDHAIVAGFASIEEEQVLLIGQQKGRGTKDNLFRNFAMAHPEGYRKAIRLMTLAQKFNRPVITFIDTPGAYPGLGAEERGQAEAIARSLYEMARLTVPIIAIVIGEGGSGGALAISVADEIHMMEYSIYSVISPEGCASILYRDATEAPQAAEALKLTAEDLKEIGIIDNIISEPSGGAHENFDASAAAIKAVILSSLKRLKAIPTEKLIAARHKKYEEIGFWLDR